MRSCPGLIVRSAVATMNQVGFVFRAGDVTLWVRDSVEIDVGLAPSTSESAPEVVPPAGFRIRAGFDSGQRDCGDWNGMGRA
jgi:hypothetical protein